MRRAVVLLTSAALATVAVLVPLRAQPASAKKVLFLMHATHNQHTSLPVAEQSALEIGREAGFEITVPDGYKQPMDKIDLSFISAKYLAQFDALMLWTNGELPLDDSQKLALIDFVRAGKGVVGIHSVLATLYGYPDFGRMLGAYYATAFNGLARDPRPVTLKVEDRNHPATRMLPEYWTVTGGEEFYAFGRGAWDPARPKENVGAAGRHIPFGFSRDKVHVLISIDTERTDMTKRPPAFDPSEDHPQAWYQDFGKGRSFYTSLGHGSSTWTDRLFRMHIQGALRWVMRLEN